MISSSHPKNSRIIDTFTVESNDVEKKGEVVVSVQTAPTSALVFPEGGRQAWLSLIGAYIGAFGVYQDFYVREYLTEHTPSEIGWIGGIQIMLTFSAGIFVGRAFDRGYFYHLMICGAIIHGLAIFMLSLSHKDSYYQVFLTNGVMMGLSAGICYIPSLGIGTHYFMKKRSMAMGIATSGSALGSVLHPIMLNQFFGGSIGFHKGVRISGGINLALFVIAIIIMRTRLPPKSAQKFPILSWMKEPAYLALFIGSWFVFLGLFYPIFYIQLSAIKHGIDHTFAFYSLSILNGASVLGRILPGVLAPRLGAYNLLSFCGIVAGVVVIFMVFANDVTSVTLVAIFYGLFSGSSIALVPSVVGSLCANMNEFGTRMGIMFFCAGILGLFATPISGALLTSDYHWIRADLFSGISLIVAGIFFLISRYFVSKQRNTQIL
uniref:Major facilitator superfamily (MFS) profile domain-containing protein n=1 Tax=Psilocybe cubensis TaxID=181762 RepID=A0A8H8CJL2_PSICU